MPLQLKLELILASNKEAVVCKSIVQGQGPQILIISNPLNLTKKTDYMFKSS